MKRIFTLMFAVFFLSKINAQEYGAYSQYMLNPVLINPALNGFDDGHSFLLNFKRQWSGFPGSPTMVTFNYNGSIADNSGVGLNIFNESVAQMNRFRAGGAYAFKIDAGDLKISMGLGADYIQQRLNNSAITDPSTDPNDPLIIAASDGISYFDAIFGAYAEYKNKFFVGFSLPHLVRARLTNIESLPEGEGTGFKSFTATVGMRKQFEELGLGIEPSLMVRRMFNGPMIYDVNFISTILDDQLFAGLTYRYTVDTGSGLGAIIGMRLQRFTVVYSYDAGFGTFQPYNNGGHEFSFRFNIPGSK
jgi:type IX secretion system PorP/SprF family membrane protein